MAAKTLSYCARQVQQYDPDRFLCALFAPPAEREGLFAIHAFSLELARIREVVREPLLGHMRLRWWSDALEAIARNQPPEHPVAAALAAAMAGSALDRRHLDRLVAGRAADLDDAPPSSVAALVDYADATSGALAAAGLQVLAAETQPCVESARDVGVAWALIGLVRAVPFHARSRRLFLPADLCREAGVDPGRLFDRGVTDGISRVARALADTAADHLRRARSRRADVPARALPVLLPAKLADLYLRRLAHAGYDPFDARLQRPEPWRLPRLAWARLRQRY
jgi:NADH dehydrogenase [ubiquinone] 1 alpha subcomplex assembly factor 6